MSRFVARSLVVVLPLFLLLLQLGGHQEEQKKQKELQEQRIKEGKAVFLLRKAIQKLSAATPESMETVQKELEETMKLHLEAIQPRQRCHQKSVPKSAARKPVARKIT